MLCLRITVFLFMIIIIIIIIIHPTEKGAQYIPSNYDVDT